MAVNKYPPLNRYLGLQFELKVG